MVNKRKSEGSLRKPRSRKPTSRNDRLGREAWILGARAMLIASGVALVKVDPLAKRLDVTTGSFYWHFKDRQELLDGLLKHWEDTNSRAFFEAIERPGSDTLENFARVSLDEENYSSAYDSAVRDWARTSPKVEAVVRRVDERRIEALHKLFLKMGEADPYAFVRARIVYFHQVGYYAMRIVEKLEDRHALLPIYTAILKGEKKVTA